MCRFCLASYTESSTIFVLCKAPILVSAENNWKEMWCKLGPTHFHTNFMCKENILLPKAKKKIMGEFMEGSHEFYINGTAH